MPLQQTLEWGHKMSKIPNIFLYTFLWRIAIAQCEIYGNLLSHFVDKNFVKAKFLLKKLQKNWFYEIFFGESEFLVFPHCELCSKSVSYGHFFCQTNGKLFAKWAQSLGYQLSQKLAHSRNEIKNSSVFHFELFRRWKKFLERWYDSGGLLKDFSLSSLLVSTSFFFYVKLVYYCFTSGKLRNFVHWT